MRGERSRGDRHGNRSPFTRVLIKKTGETHMAQTTSGAFEQCSDEVLMQRYFELSASPENHAEELAMIDAAIQARLFAAYGAAPPGSSPRIRLAVSNPMQRSA
jgi:hypothetical protein